VSLVKVVAFVPIKLNNERLPHKNILPLGGCPVCQHLLQTLLNVKLIDEVIVFCSDNAIRQYLPEGVELLIRDQRLDNFNTKHYEIVESFISQIHADVYVNAHVTNPFISKKTFDEGVFGIISGTYDSAVVVEEVQEHLWYDSEPFNFTRHDRPRKQDLKALYAEVGVFMYRKEVFLNGRTDYGARPLFIKIGRIEALDIDYMEDYELAKAIITINANNRG
jgi:CMP-N-acetylneuraminic acid synthetase